MINKNQLLILVVVVSALLVLETDIAYGGEESALLLEAAAKGDVAKTKELLSKEADVNARSETGVSALMAAGLDEKNDPVVKLLLAKGADSLHFLIGGARMSAFVVSEVEIINDDAASQYRQLAAASIAAYGGRYLVRGAEAVVVEGEPTKRRIIIVEFPSMRHIRKWYASPEYAKALKFRDAALERRLVFVEGVNPHP